MFYNDIRGKGGLESRPDRFNFEKKFPPIFTDHEGVVVSRVRLDILGCINFFSLRRPKPRKKVRVYSLRHIIFWKINQA
jgi:hypothetical protein